MEAASEGQREAGASPDDTDEVFCVRTCVQTDNINISGRLLT